MQRAVNPQTGEVLFLVDNQWVPPARTAKNDQGDTAYLVGNRWEIVSGAPGGLASIAKPEPTLSPEEQMMGAIGAAPSPQEALPRLPGGQAEMRPYEPSLTDQLMELLPGNKYKAANEYAARQIAKERGVPVGEIYKDIGGTRPMFNPEGRAPIRAGVEAAKITAQELPKVPEATLSTFLKAYRAGDIEAPVDTGMVDRAIASMKPTDAKGKPDPNYESFLGLGESLGFSVATMVASLTAAAAGEVVAGPAGGVAAGMGASGAMAYRASKDDFLSRVRDKLNKESQKLYGTNISPEDWNKAKQEYNQAAVEYGAWEAIPEAVSNAVFIKAFASPVKTGRGAAKMNSAIEKIGSQGVEQATETMTALGQNAAERKAGLSEEELSIADAFRQQFIQTLLIGGTMAGGMKAKEIGDKFYSEVVEPRVRPGSALAKAIQADVDAVAFNPESTRRAAVQALDPNRAQERVALEPGIDSLMQKQQVAMPPPPEEPEEPVAEKVAEEVKAPVSASQDTDAMLREALGEDINTVNMPKEEAPVEVPAAEAQKEELPSTKLIQEVLPEAPKPELTLKEQYDKAAKMNFMAGDAFRNKLINQEQLDKIRSDYERIKAEYQASIPKSELSPIQQEATEIADKLEALGLKPFADGMRTSIDKNQVKEQNLEFYRTKLKQEQAKQSTLEEGVERPSEKWNWTDFYGDDTKGLEKLKLFNSKAPPAVKQTLQDLTDSIQAITDRLNDEGYAMRGAAELNVPDEIKNLRSQIMLRSAEGSLLINKFEALNKGFKRSKNTTNQQNLDTAIQEAKVGIAEAQKSLQRSIPEPEEVVNARAVLAEANKRVETLEYKSGSLWSALMGKLDPEEVREIFGPNPSLGEKKLQVTKKSGKRGTYISEMAANGTLDPFLPPAMRHESSRFDAAESAQYIKDAVANKDYLPHDVKAEIEDIYRGVEPLGDLIDEYLTIEEQNRELQIAADEQREADQATEIVEPEGEDRAAKPSERPAGELELSTQTADELKAKQDEIDRLTKENERLAKEAEAKAKADEEAKDFVLTGSNREADVAAARGQKDIFAEAEETPKEEPKAPKGTVATPDGAVLRYPLAVSMVGEGYKVLALDDPRTYKDKGGEPHRTFEKGPLRISMTPQRVLFQNRNAVNVAFGNPDDVTLEALLVDPGSRNKGLASKALQEVIEAADKNEITLYLEPVPIVNIKKNDFGLDRDQLVDFYSKFGFEFQEDSNKVMQRKPSAEVEVLPAEEPQAAGLIENEPYTFEGDFTEVAEEQQRLMLENQTENLSDAQVETLEKHYGVGIDTDEFFTKLREDVSNFIVQGATAVNGKIRAIIRQLANGLLSVAIAFNPQYMSQPLNVFMPEDNVRAEEVLATVPDAATAKMSEPGKRAFAVIYPAIQEQMQSKDKLFIVADKPSGRVFVFNPDGSLLLEKKSLFGLAKGDIYVGDNDKPQNRITPAGLFDLQLIDAKKGESEKRTAGDYDTGTVLAINDPDGRITIMHSVWLKENDAAQRAAALRNESAADSRYSFGCINVDAPTYKFLVNNHAKQMDGAALFIVPEVGTDVMSFITGKGAMSEDLARVKIKPVTKVTKTPKKQATPAAAQTKVPGKEEEIFMSLEPQTQTQAFKKWFGDSKVVDADGKPLVVYHGTNEDFDVFDPYAERKTQGGERLRGTNAIFFSSNPELASAYAGVAKSTLTGQSFAYPAESAYGGNVMPVYLSMQNPMIVDAEGQMYTKVEPLIREAKKKGHDGVIFKNVADQPGAAGSLQVTAHDAYVVFKPEQIKSATGNRGTFDESGNINMSLEDDLVRLVNQIADSIDENEKKRSPSMKRKVKTLTNQRNEGKLTDEEYLERVNAAIEEDEENRLNKKVTDRQRGADFIREKLLNAKRKGFLSEKAVDLAEWFIQQNPALVDDLGISVIGKGPEGAGGFYNNIARVINLMKDMGTDVTATHEILHHLERMMPAKIQAAIRKAWLTQLLKANKATKDPAQKLYFAALLDAHIGNNNHDRLEIPKGSEKIYETAVRHMKFANEMRGGRGANPKSIELAKELLINSTVPIDLYQYFDASEFWAVNGSDIVRARYDAVKGGTLAKLKNWLRELAQKIKSMLGLKSDASIIRALDSLAKSDGKFVTKDMLGTGDYQNIKRNALGGEMPKATWAMRESTVGNDWIQRWQDNFRDLKNVQKAITEQIGKIDDRLNAYRKQTVNPGREAERQGDFVKYEVDPLVKEMIANKVSNQELATYLHNRYAEERNEIINAKNKSPSVQNQGSGISTENARKYMENLPADRARVLESLAKRIDKIVRGSQDILVESGQETQETIDGWRKSSPHYVPLQRDESELDFIVQTGTGSLGGYATAGKFGKEAIGSTKTVKNILENVMLQRDRAIRRAESIRIGQALYGMAIQYPNPNFWMAINPDAVKDMDALIAEMEEMGLDPELIENILEQPKTGYVKKTTGPEGETVREVKYRVDRAYQNAKNVFPIRINGQNRYVLFNPKSPEALRLAAELKQLNPEQLNLFFGVASSFSRWFAAVNTQYNPVFGLVNFWNDTQGALINLSTTPLSGQQSTVLKNVLPAMHGIARDIRKERKETVKRPIKTAYGEEIDSTDWTNLWRLYRNGGGKTAFRDQMVKPKLNVEWKGLMPNFSYTDSHTMLEALEKIEQGPISKKVEWWADAFSDFNDTLENTVRLSVFKVAYIDNKLPIEEAIDIAKNITVDFNRRGARTKNVRGMYVFFNAALQSNVRIATTLAAPVGKTIVKAGLAMGALNAVWMLMAGFDDDDPPQFTRNKGFIVPTGNGDYFLWNLPQGWRAIPNTGRLVTEGVFISVGLMKSNKGLAGKISDAGGVVFDAINPFGGGTLLQTAAPTFLDPAMALAENKDSFGRPIFKEDLSLKPTPGWQRTRDSASTFSKGLSWLLNYISAGGEEFDKGFLSPTGDQIDYLISQAAGGFARDVKRTGEWAYNAATGEETPSYRKPVLNRFIGETKTDAAASARFYDNVTMLARYENIINGRIENKGDVQGYLKENPLAKFAFVANDFENEVSSINRTIIDLQNMDETPERKKQIKDLKATRIELMKNFNSMVRQAQ